MMRPLAEMSLTELSALAADLAAEFARSKDLRLSLNIARGRPAPEQLNLSSGLFAALGNGDPVSAAGEDVRNYGGDPLGLLELREIFAPLLGVPPGQVAAGGNSSLAMMHDVLVWALLKGLPGGDGPWAKAGDIAMLCPAPGYELHHRMARDLGITLIPVPVGPDGPDMQSVEDAVQDPAVRGMWCVPTYANPTGEVYSDATVDRLAAMPTGAPDFRLFWDDAYMVHHFGDDGLAAKNILHAAERAGHPDRPLVFTSTSKITFASAGVGFLAASPANIAWYRACRALRGPGENKLVQLAHARFFGTDAGVLRHMRAHAAVLAPKFLAVDKALGDRLQGHDIARWSRPRGGYFISLETPEGTARRAVALAAQAGVTLTEAGSTWPAGTDPTDSSIRIAPSFASQAEVGQAAEVIALSVLIAAVEMEIAARRKTAVTSPGPATNERPEGPAPAGHTAGDDGRSCRSASGAGNFRRPGLQG